MDNPYIAYAKTNADGYIIAINSSVFLQDTTGWVEIDRGWGDKYHHAQANYLRETLQNTKGAFNYKMVEGRPVKCSPAEIQDQEKNINTPVAIPERIVRLERSIERFATILKIDI